MDKEPKNIEINIEIKPENVVSEKSFEITFEKLASNACEYDGWYSETSIF